MVSPMPPGTTSSPVLEQVSIHTPEGITFELELAGIGTRFLGAVIDVCALSIILVVLAWGVSITSFGDSIGTGYLTAVLITLLFLLMFGYGLFCEQVFGGRTLGKLATRTRVTGAEGGAVRAAQSAIRAVLWPFEVLMMPILGLGAALTTQHGQRLGDLGAGTFVIRDSRRVRVGDRVAPTMAAHDPQAVFRTWDLTAIDADDVALARSFLSRRRRLAPSARAAIATALDQRIRPRVHGPDGSWPTELLLEAVVAAKTLGRDADHHPVPPSM